MIRRGCELHIKLILDVLSFGLAWVITSKLLSFISSEIRLFYFIIQAKISTVKWSQWNQVCSLSLKENMTDEVIAASIALG